MSVNPWDMEKEAWDKYRTSTEEKLEAARASGYDGPPGEKDDPWPEWLVRARRLLLRGSVDVEYGYRSVRLPGTLPSRNCIILSPSSAPALFFPTLSIPTWTTSTTDSCPFCSPTSYTLRLQ